MEMATKNAHGITEKSEIAREKLGEIAGNLP